MVYNIDSERKHTSKRKAVIMKVVRVSKSIMDALNAKGYAEGKKFVYVLHDKLSQNCIEVMRFPPPSRYYARIRGLI